jgi:cytochrome P450
MELRMTSEAPVTADFFDAETNRCPYPTYAALRDEAPVWRDPKTGMFFLTRYEDIRAALADPETFTNRVGSAAGRTEKAVRPSDPDEAAAMDEADALNAKIAQMYEEEGWSTVATLDALDAPEHMQLRRMFAHAFRPDRVATLDPYVEALAHSLVDAFVDRGECEFVDEFAVPLPLYTIGKQMGVPEEDMPRIKTWTDAWVQRLGLVQTPEERLRSVELEIEGQQYFQPIFERLRQQPDETVLSDVVNTEIPEWGRKLNDNELHSEMFADFFVGGSETTTHALAAGAMMLAQDPDLFAALKADPEKHIPVFAEEVVRLETPVQGLPRETSVDVTLHGVDIPAGSIVMLRFASGNRDERHYSQCPAEVDLTRARPRGHLGFGMGPHVCLGVSLARRELYFGFKVLCERLARLELLVAPGEVEIRPSYFLRSTKALPLAFTPA